MAPIKANKEERKKQTQRFNILLSYLKESGAYKNNIDLCEKVDINRSYLSSVITGQVSPHGVALKICEHFKLPYLTWVDTGEGNSPITQYANGARYLGHLEETESLLNKINKPFSPIVLPDNLVCECVFIYRGKMYFVNKQPQYKKFIDTGAKYYIELDDDTKLIKRITEESAKDTRILTFYEPDNSVQPFKLSIDRVTCAYRIIAVLEFTR